MSNADREVVQYLKLATISRAKQQMAGCDRFLVLAGAAACRSGLLDVAEACRARVLENNPHHLLKRFTTFADALRSEDFPVFLKQMERFCTTERAEMLLSELDQAVEPDAEAAAHEQSLELLADPAWEQ